MSITFVLLVLALLCFALAAFNVNNRFFSWVPMGLALCVFTVIVWGWPTWALLPHQR